MAENLNSHSRTSTDVIHKLNKGRVPIKDIAHQALDNDTQKELL